MVILSSTFTECMIKKQMSFVLLKIALEGVWGIHSRNVEQAMALDAFLDDSVRLVTISGQAGTGKHFNGNSSGSSKKPLMKTSIKNSWFQDQCFH